MDDKIREWLEKYLRWKDSIDQAIISIDVSGDEMIVKYAEKETRYLIMPEITVDACENIVCVNNKKNLDYIIRHWKELVKSKCTIILINPDMKDKWIIKPFVHEMIADPESLEQGLKSMQASSLTGTDP